MELKLKTQQAQQLNLGSGTVFTSTTQLEQVTLKGL